MDTNTIAFLSFFLLVIATIAGIPIYLSVKRAKFKRDAAYALSANAVVIGKRSQIEILNETSYTYNLVTFEIEGVGRIEFNVGNMIGLLVEGDRGILRYLTNPYRFVDFNITERSQKFQ